MPGTVHFSFDIDGDRELSAKLHGVLSAVSDLRPAFQAMADDWATTMKAKFAAEGNHETGTNEAGEALSGWAPLSARYAAWKAKHYPEAGLLVRTGALRAAATAPETQIEPQSLRLSIGTPYAIYHQSSRPRTSNLPRRPFASLTAKQQGRWVRALREHIRNATRT